MAHRIFLSHKHEDKPLVEQVALKLKEIYGEDAIFYDSWSIKPGEGIIERINTGLTAPEFVFFFVSELSLKSEMVKLEWQNALYKSTKGETKLIPVRVQNVAMPEVLRQTVYIDMYGVGLETAIAQIVNLVQGNSSFTPQHEGFSNLTQMVHVQPDGAVLVTIEASHLMEPNPQFVVLLDNREEEIADIELNGGANKLSKWYDKPFDHQLHNGFSIAPLGGAITPERPMKVLIKPKTPEAKIVVTGIVHGWSAPFRAVPLKPGWGSGWK